MNTYLEKIRDRLNPIFFNDLRKTRKAYSFWFNIIFLLIVYLVIFYYLLITKGTRNFDPYSKYVLTVLFLTAFEVIPLELRNMSLNELKNEDMFFLFMTNLNVSKFIKGKLLLGLFYFSIFLLMASPIYLFIYFSGIIDTIALLRSIFYTIIIPLNMFIVFIGLGLDENLKKNQSKYVDGIPLIILMQMFGFLFVFLGFYEGIIEIKIDSELSILFIDLSISIIFFILSTLFYLLLYISLLRRYPIGEISIKPKSRKGFTYKKNDTQTIEIINQENTYNSNQNENNNLCNNNSVDDLHKELSINNLSSKKNNNSISLSEIKLQRKANLSLEIITKLYLTFVLIISNCFVYFKSFLGHIFLFLFIGLFPVISIYYQSKGKKYDNKSKLEIPESSINKYIKFPFVNGYVNNVVWLSMLCVINIIVLVLTYGFYKTTKNYNITDSFYGGYYVIIGSMLNTFSWCFIGKYLSEKLFKNKKNGNYDVAITAFILIFVSLSPLLISGKQQIFRTIIYILPTMPIFVEDRFFKQNIAFFSNLIFFIVTIILHLKSMKEQAISYFTYKEDSEDTNNT